MRAKKVNFRKLVILVLVLAGICCLCLIAAWFSGTKDHQDCLKRIAPNADLANCYFNRNELQGKNFQGANLTSANLSGVNLANADLSNVNLTSANLSDANLMNANLQNTTLTNVNFSSAKLTGASFDGAVWSSVNLVNATGVDDEILSHWLNVTTDQLSAALYQHMIRLERRDDIINKLKVVCSGKGVPEAAEYSPGDSFHSVILLRGGDKVQFTADMDKQWGEPMALRFSSIVACLGYQETEQYKTCSYQGTEERADIYKMDVQIRAAHTGQLIESKTVYGSIPTCPDSIVTGAVNTYIHGDEVSFLDIEKMLASYVNPP